jgi:hypothetical protein
MKYVPSAAGHTQKDGALSSEKFSKEGADDTETVIPKAKKIIYFSNRMISNYLSN